MSEPLLIRAEEAARLMGIGRSKGAFRRDAGSRGDAQDRRPASHVDVLRGLARLDMRRSQVAVRQVPCRGGPRAEGGPGLEGGARGQRVGRPVSSALVPCAARRLASRGTHRPRISSRQLNGEEPHSSYNESDWGAYVNDVAVSNFAFVMHGPTPELSAGDLPVGKTAAGWIVFEVPSKGKATVVYQPGRNSIFEVTLRAS